MVEVIIKLVSNPKFAAMMQEKINSKVDTTAIEQEIAAAEKQLRQYYSVKSKIMEEIDTLDPDDRHYIIRKSDLDERLYRMYDKIEEAENNLMDARAKKQAIEADKITGDNIYKVLICFEKLYNVMNPLERKKLMEHLISEIQIYPERQPNDQWLKSIKFRLPTVESDIDLRSDNESRTECVIALSKGEIDSKKVRVEFSLEGMDTSGLQKGATYPEIKARVLEQTGLKVSSLYISQVKQKCGLEVRENHHKAKSENTKQPQCPKEKEDAIVEALRHFQMI